MNDTPERIWPKELYCLHPDVKTFGMMITYPERKKYVLGDLLPRWRPIAELPNEWKDGRVIVLRFADGDVSTFDGIDAREWRNYLRVNKPLILEFLDFGGKSMPE